jgi:hypothetical protein
VLLQIARGGKYAIADSEPKFVVASWATRQPANPGASLATAVAVRWPENVFSADSNWRSRAPIRALLREAH